MSFVQFLQAKMDEKGVNQAYLARYTGRSRTTISNIFAGKNFDLRILPELEKALDLPINTLMDAYHNITKPEDDKDLDEINYIYSLLPPEYRKSAKSYLKYLHRESIGGFDAQEGTSSPDID